MTDRLSQLLHDEATELVPPPPDASAILVRGRQLRRRQRITTGTAVLAVAATVVATAGFVALQSSDRTAREIGPATAPDAPATVSYAVGSDVVVDQTVAQVPDTVHSLHYTAAGVLVRSNPNGGSSDGSGPESLTLVRDDGSTVDLGTIPEGVGPATDPAENVYALAEKDGDGFVAVLREAESGEVVQEVPLPDLAKSFWDVPPLALDGDTLFAGYKNETVSIDLGSGEVSPVDGMRGGIPEVSNGRTVLTEPGSLVVRDITTGLDLLTVDLEGYAWGTLSPDGRFLRVMNEGGVSDGEWVEPTSIQVYDVDSGQVREFEDPSGWGWSADGGLFRVDAKGVTTCDAATGECATRPAAVPVTKNDFPKLGGLLYES